MDRAPIDADALRSAAGPRWARVEVVGHADSTNAALLADAGAPDRTVLVAEHQSLGRGRLDRAWSSPRSAGLLFSVLLRPSAPIATWGWLPLLTGVALREAVAAETGLAVALKWPNDLLSAPTEHKLAGILAQTSGDAVVVGVGLNVSTTQDELPVPNATSLELCGAQALDRTRLLAAILGRLDARAAQWDDVRGDAAACGLAADYLAACATIGRDVAVTTTAGGVLRGTAVGLDPDGRLQVAAGDTGDTVTAVGAGDVEHLRPAD